MSEFAVSDARDNGVADFYASERGIGNEAERLQSAATRLANPISIEALRPALEAGNTVLDIGAGADATLGKNVKNKGCNYVAVEPNRDFVTILQKAGIDAWQGDVTNVPIESNSVDAVHMRFLFGWLNERQRKSALQQAARVLRPGDQKTVTVIDYDWLRSDGPDDYMKAVGVACDILKSFGFDYEYGSKLPSDIEELASHSVLGDAVEYEIQPSVTHEISKTLGEGLPILEEAASSLQEGLSALGDTERTEALSEAIDALRNVNPEIEITLPGITVQTVVITKHTPSAERSNNTTLVALEKAHTGSQYEGDFETAEIPGVVKIEVGSELDNYVRRMQAAEYLKEGILESATMINENGMLCEESYPEDVVRRSISLATLSSENIPTAAVRLIETEEGGDPDEQLSSLPTAAHLGLEMSNRSVFPEGATADGVIEVSALLRNSKEGGRLLDVAHVMIGAAVEAKKRGHHTGLITTQKGAWKFMKGLLGEENFVVLEDLHESDIPGASKDVEFVCLAVDVQSFLDGVRAHVVQKKDASKILAEINLLLDEYYTRELAA